MPLISLSQTVGSLFPDLIPSSPQSTYAAWPVWRDSTTAEVKFHPLSKKEAAKWRHKARRFDAPGRGAGNCAASRWARNQA